MAMCKILELRNLRLNHLQAFVHGMHNKLISKIRHCTHAIYAPSMHKDNEFSEFQTTILVKSNCMLVLSFSQFQHKCWFVFESNAFQFDSESDLWCDVSIDVWFMWTYFNIIVDWTHSLSRYPNQKYGVSNNKQCLLLTAANGLVINMMRSNSISLCFITSISFHFCFLFKHMCQNLMYKCNFNFCVCFLVYASINHFYVRFRYIRFVGCSIQKSLLFHNLMSSAVILSTRVLRFS